MGQREKISRMTQIALFIALLAVLGFTPLGFIRIPPISITLMHIPVIVGAILLGPGCGALFGLTFGIISLINAIMAPVPPLGLLLSPMVSGYPLRSVIICVVPRVLLGLIAGLLYKLFLRAVKKKRVAIGIAAGASTICHTVMVLGGMWLLFDAIPLMSIFLTVVSVNGVLELIAAIAVSALIIMPLQKALKLEK